jgi:uncharacterized protein YfiM (DUF2279 family)
LRQVSIAAALLAFSIGAAPLAAQTHDTTAVANNRLVPRDSFLGLDKPKHFLLSFFIQGATFAVIQKTGAGRGAAIGGASAVTFGFAIGREVHDRKTKGLFSLGDLFWDAVGAGTASLMLRHTY